MAASGGTVTVYLFSESVHAGSTSAIHISPVGPEGPQTSGGAPAPLCGQWTQGWHIRSDDPVSERTLKIMADADARGAVGCRVCTTCRDDWRQIASRVTPPK